MRSSASDLPAVPDRWDYAAAELGELPDEARPSDREPSPDSQACPGWSLRACGAPIPPRWAPPWGHPGSGFSVPGHWIQPHLCAACAAARAEASARDRLRDLVAEAGLPARYTWADFDRHAKQARGEDWAAFRDRLEALAAGGPPVFGVTGWNVRAAQVVRDWRPTLAARPSPRVVFLTGPVGSGKTTLAAAAALAALRDLARRREACETGADRYRIVWASVSEVWEAVRQESAGRSRERGTIARLAAADVLYLDDLGALENVRAWHRDALEYVVCSRYDRDRPTLITSNLRLDSEDEAEPTIAATFGERVVSRLVEGLGGRRRGPPPGYLELLGWDWRADVPHPTPDPARPASPSAGPATPTPSAAVARAAQLPLDWRQRQAADRDDD